jgi:hypothetical protein
MSKTNIKMSQPTYIVKKYDGVIICKIITQGNWEIFRNLYSGFITTKIRKKFPIRWIDESLTFTAVVRHHKSDVWNETLGKHIAESKCKKKIYNFYKRLYKTILEEIINTDIKDLTKYVDNLTFCELREEKHFKDLIGN